MRLTYSTMYAKFLRNISSVGNVDANITAEFNYQLGVYYQMMLAKLANYRTYISTTFATVANTQYYAYPPGYVNTDGMVITVGSVNFPLKIIQSEYLWEQLNAITVQASALPQFYFPRRDDFGIWPIPQAIYTGNLYYHYRDRNLSIADVNGGTITATSGSATITGTAGIFTSAMVGSWFTITDPLVYGQGYFYRITGYVNSNTLTLSRTYVGNTASTTQYTIGQTPEIPEEGHAILLNGVMAGFYSEYRKDLDSGTLYSNLFYTGDPANPLREVGNTKISGGLIDMINRYSDRDDARVINRKPRLNPLQYKVWATTLA